MLKYFSVNHFCFTKCHQSADSGKNGNRADPFYSRDLKAHAYLIIEFAADQISHRVALDVIQVPVFSASGHGWKEETVEAVSRHVAQVVDDANARRNDAGARLRVVAGPEFLGRVFEHVRFCRTLEARSGDRRSEVDEFRGRLSLLG